MTVGRRLAWAVALLVTLPVLAVAGLTWRLVSDQEAVARMELDALLDERLADVERPLMAGLERVERSLLQTLDKAELTPEALRALRRRAPLASQVFALDKTGKLIFPPENETRSEAEKAFAERTADIWAGRAILYEPPPPEQSKLGFRLRGSSTIDGDDVLSLASRRDHGWIAWYWQDGLRLLFWRRHPVGVVGIEVERVVLLAHVLGSLPELGITEDRVVLVDARGDPVQQWGPFDPSPDAEASAMRRLPHPLDGSTLRYYVSANRAGALLGGGTPWGAALGMLAMIGVIAGLGVYAYRESSRQVREAAQRVTFVTQVSHELKTPLSNIRLYAELLEGQLEDEDDAAAARVGIIVSESQRLARLIDNVLVFAKVRRGTHRIEPVPMSADDAVQRVLEQFRPALEVKGILPELELEAPRPVIADPDAVEQIVANLVGNVEKYAADGRRLSLVTEQDEARTRLIVGDEGPGIPSAARGRIFEPFYRVSDKLSDGVTGTGIGLAIASQLAEETGGRLRLLPRSPGAWFELELPTQGGASG